jgi:hypothetical protein
VAALELLSQLSRDLTRSELPGAKALSHASQHLATASASPSVEPVSSSSLSLSSTVVDSILLENDRLNARVLALTRQLSLSTARCEELQMENDLQEKIIRQNALIIQKITEKMKKFKLNKHNNE